MGCEYQSELPECQIHKHCNHYMDYEIPMIRVCRIADHNLMYHNK